MPVTESPQVPQYARSGWLPEELRTARAVPEMLYALFEGNPDMVVVVDAQQRIAAANAAALAEFGYSRDELEGQPLEMLLPESVRTRHGDHVESFFRHPSVRTMGSGMSLRGRRADGREFPVDVQLWPVMAPTGQCVVAVCRRLDAALAWSQAQMQAMVEGVREYAINMLDPQGRILTWNEGSRRIHGLSAHEALGQSFTMFFTAGDIAKGVPQRLLEQAAEAGRCHTEGWRVGAGGRAVWAEIDYTAVRDESGQLAGFIRVMHDMTSHRRADEVLRETNRALSEAEERLRLLIEGVTDYAIYMLDPEGRVLTWNVGAERNKGYKAEEVLGREFSMFFPPEEQAAGVPARELAEAAQEGRFETEGERVRKDGTRFWAQVTLTAIRGAEGELKGFAKVTRDITEQRRSLEAMRNLNAQLDRYRIVVETIDEYSIYTLDPEGRITSWEAGAQKNSGVGPEAMIGRNYSQFFTPDDLAAGLPARELAEAARDGRLVTESWRITPRGKRVWSVGSMNAVRDEEGRVTGFVRIARMMTEQKEAEQALRALNAELQHYRTIIDTIDEYGIYALDADGYIVTWGKGAQKMSGLPREQAMGRHFSIFDSGPDSGEAARELETAARLGHCSSEGWRRRPTDGALMWAAGELTAIRDEGGVLTGFTRVTRDMTRQKQADDALRALNAELQRYRIIVENVRDHVVLSLDPDGYIVSWSPGSEKVVGYTAEEALCRPYSLLFPPEAVEAGEPRRELEEVARSGQCSTASWRQRKGGALYWSVGETTAVRDGDGKLTGFVRVSRDMTQQKMLEGSLARLAADLEVRVAERTAQLESTVEELKRKNEEVEAFVYIVSHDLRAPLVNVQGFARELELSSATLKTILGDAALAAPTMEAVREVLESDIGGAIRFISASATKFERLIDALLGLSRLGRQVYQPVRVDMQALAEQSVASMRHIIDAAQGQVRVGNLPMVIGDLTALGQVVSNLIGNCVKYRNPERLLEIEIGGESAEGKAHFWVRDNGLGIPESGKSRLFQVFQRLHPHLAPGEGMGLAIANLIVQRHGGRIWAESVEGEGAAFHFTIPCDGSEAGP